VIILFKDTSLVAGIALFDLLREAQDHAMTDSRIEALAIAFVLYLLISSILVFVFNRLEKRFSVSL
jgi:polar amino acid transport system permease protein